MKNRITLEKFYESAKRLSDKTIFVKGHIDNTYMPIKQKLEHLKVANHNSIVNGEISPVLNYLEYIKALIIIYTTIDVSVTPAIDVYDMLQESGTLPLILGLIGEEKLKEMNMFLTFIRDSEVGEQ